MIFDNISNIHIYNLPRVVTDFVSELNSDTKSGRCEICDGIYANIESYNTKLINDAVFEAHENYIDIQILLDGIENIYYCPKGDLEVKIPYNKEKDIVFYAENINNHEFVKLNGSNFVILYPHEAHAPQVSINNTPMQVKKVVIKIRKDLLL